MLAYDNFVIPGVTEKQIKSLKDLPDNWFDEPINSLNGGQLLCIVLHANKSLLSLIEKLDERITMLETKNAELGSENNMMIGKNEDEFKVLKKVIVNQQSFIEGVKRDKLGKNVIITGIPNDVVVINNIEYRSTEEKVNAVLGQIDVILSENDYEVKTMDTLEGRSTHITGLIFRNMETKKRLMKETRKLKDNEHFRTVYIKNDETKLARNENYRLRQKLRALRSDHPNAQLKLEKGKLIHNSTVVDKYDINNQIFRQYQI